MQQKTIGKDGRCGPPPSEALKVIDTYPAMMGITRLAEITGLDRLGIPVIQAVRPLALSNAVSQGKGFDGVSAALSAILEAAETFFAEQVSKFECVNDTANRLGIEHLYHENHFLPGLAVDWREISIPWVRAADLITKEVGYVPLELVHTAYIDPPIKGDGIFLATTSGLAVALDWQDAVLHGIFECIERDALAKAQKTHGFFQRNRIDPGTLAEGRVLDLILEMEKKGMMVGLWAMEAVGGLPAIWCQLMEDRLDGAIMPFPADGFAVSGDPYSAIEKAIEEAAQCRLAAISGSRDDMTRASYPQKPDWNSIETHHRLLKTGPMEIDFASVAQMALPVEKGWLAATIERLRTASIGAILVSDIDTEPFENLFSVRVIIPELEPLVEYA